MEIHWMQPYIKKKTKQKKQQNTHTHTHTWGGGILWKYWAQIQKVNVTNSELLFQALDRFHTKNVQDHTIYYTLSANIVSGKWEF